MTNLTRIYALLEDHKGYFFKKISSIINLFNINNSILENSIQKIREKKELKKIILEQKSKFKQYEFVGVLFPYSEFEIDMIHKDCDIGFIQNIWEGPFEEIKYNMIIMCKHRLRQLPKDRFHTLKPYYKICHASELKKIDENEFLQEFPQLNILKQD